MGNDWCPSTPECFSCFRAKFIPERSLPLQDLGRPKEAEDIIDGESNIIEDDILIVNNIDPCISINGPDHNTENYEIMKRTKEPQLVVRRGQNFQVKITLNRPYQDTDLISFIFTVEDEEKPNYGQGTLIAVPLMKKPDKELPWNAVLEESTDKTLTVNILTSPEAVVSKWIMDVDTMVPSTHAYSYSWETRIYLLFNPWCEEDPVYMSSEIWKDETILTDVGLIWRGTANSMKPCIWKYDQFQRSVLECAYYLVKEVGKVKSGLRGDAVVTSRALAAAVNSLDNDGVVMGNWSEDMSGGTSPTKWLGSGEILQKYYEKKKPVKYGQCWVFAGVLTSVCRTLGIPCRTVTNYSSAHDTQNSLTVDYFVGDDGSVLKDLTDDSIWNFHVWNEVWMSRPDLGEEYKGWQAIDATPQELSDHMYRCGPASVVAVKKGEIKRPYDNAFLFAEVNADKVYWKYSGPRKPLKLINKDTYGVGKLIITKAPGVFEREEITLTYKFPEKTEDERNIMLKALLQADNKFARYYLNENFNDIRFDLQLHDDIKIGQDFDVTLYVGNRNYTKEFNINAIITVEVVTYTGKVGEIVKKENLKVTLKPRSKQDVKLSVTYKDYKQKLLDQSAFNISCLASVDENEFEYYVQDDFRVCKPPVVLKLKNKPVEGKECFVDVYVENPLPVSLKKGEFTIDTPGLDKPVRIKLKREVFPGKRAEAVFSFFPTSAGRQTIGAKFFAKEMDDCDGYLTITVEANKETNGGI